MPLKHVEIDDVEILEGTHGSYFVTLIKHPYATALFGPASQADCERWCQAKLVKGMATAPIRMEKPIAEEKGK